MHHAEQRPHHLGYRLALAFDVCHADQQIADVTSYIRNSWGNQAQPVSESDVRELRTAIGAAKAVDSK